MPSIHCHFPVTVQITGRLDDDALARLAAEVERALGELIDRAGRELARHHGAHPGTVVAQPGQQGEASTGLGVAGETARTRPWLVLRALNFRTTVGDFFDWVDDNRSEPLAERVLYSDLDADVRWVAVWWVQTNRTVTLDELLAKLVARAQELAHVGGAETLLFGITPFDANRSALADLDPSGRVRALPSLHERNARRVRGRGGEAELLHGSWVIFAFMVLPKIEAADLLVIGAEATVEVPLRDTAFLFDTAQLEAASGVGWDVLVAEFGDDPVPVSLLPATVRKPAATPAIGYLLSKVAGDMAVTGSRAATTSARAGLPVQRLWLLTEAALATLPMPVRRLAQSWTDAATLGMDAATAVDRVPTGARLLYGKAVLPIDRERLVTAQLRPQASQLAEQLRQRLSGDPSEFEWRWGLYGFLGANFGDRGPEVRPVGGTLFEHVLAELEASGDLVRLYDLVDASGHFALRHRLLLHSLSTRYANHPRIRRLFEELSARALQSLADSYHPELDPPEIWFGGDPRQRVRAGEVLGDFNSVYIVEKDLEELKPTRAAELREAVVKARKDLVEKIGDGTNSTEYSDEEFATEVLARAAQAIKITKADFVESTIQRSIKIEGVSRRTIESLPTFEVAFRFVERRKGSGPEWTAVSESASKGSGPEWTAVSEIHRETADDFTARLIYWRLGRAGEFYEAMGIVVTGVGLFAVAWSAGIIAALVSLAGGATVVGVSIGIAEVIYMLRVVFGDAKLTLGGFLLAALDGYLGALGFRVGAGLGQLVAGKVGTATLRRLVAGWVAQKLVTGMVGGALTSGLTTFANDVVNIATGKGGWSTIGDYVRGMAIGAVFGIVAEFTVAPALNALLARGGSTLASAADLVQQVRSQGWSSIQLSATLTEGLANMRAALTELAGEVTASGFTRAFAARLGPVLEQMAAGAVSRRVLELAGARFTRQATEGLERFLVAAEAGTPARALAITNVFARNAQETVHFLEALSQLDAAVVRRLVDGTFGSQQDLAAFLGRLARYTPEQQRAAVRLLGELDIQVGSPIPGMTTEQVLQRQLDLSLGVQSAGVRIEADQVRREIARLQERLSRTDPGNLRRVEALRSQLEEQNLRLADLEARAERAAAARSGGPRDVVPTDAEVERRLAELEAGTAAGGTKVWVRLPARSVRNSPEVVERLVRPIFRSRSGNRVVFRVEGGSDPTSRSYDFVRVDDSGNVVLATGGRALNLNFGVFERALEFLLENRAGARLKVFEIEEGWFRAVRGVSTPEQGFGAALNELDPITGAVRGPAGRAGGISDVRGLPRTVDTRTGEDQLQVPATLVRELQEFIVPGSGRVLEFL